jgi:hypothetical protein
MLAALTLVESWLLFGACIAVGVTVYVVVAGGRRYRAIDAEWHRIRWERRNGGGLISFPPGTSLQEVESFVRVFGGIYDHEARGDFDRPWTFDHDPTVDFDRCEVCNALLRRAFNRLADRDLGPRDADTLMAAIREELEP